MPTQSNMWPEFSLSVGNWPSSGGRGLPATDWQMMLLCVMDRMAVCPPMMWKRHAREAATRVGPPYKCLSCLASIIYLVNEFFARSIRR